MIRTIIDLVIATQDKGAQTVDYLNGLLQRSEDRMQWNRWYVATGRPAPPLAQQLVEEVRDTIPKLPDLPIPTVVAPRDLLRNETLLSESIIEASPIRKVLWIPARADLQAAATRADQYLYHLVSGLRNRATGFPAVVGDTLKRFPSVLCAMLPRPGLKFWVCAGATVLPVVALIGFAAWSAPKLYSWSQRKDLHLADHMAQREQYLDGDLGLVDNLRMITRPRVVRWAKAWRARMAAGSRYGDDLFEAQRMLRACFEVHGFVGEEFITGCISSLGDFRALARGELYIQLNRHLLGFIKSRPQGFELEMEQIIALRAAVDMACGDHVQVQISR